MEVTLRKLGKGPGSAVTGRLTRAPRKGSVIVVEFSDGLHEYVTTPVHRVLKIVEQGVYYIQTSNSRYRLEFREKNEALLEAPAAR